MPLKALRLVSPRSLLLRWSHWYVSMVCKLLSYCNTHRLCTEHMHVWDSCRLLMDRTRVIWSWICLGLVWPCIVERCPCPPGRRGVLLHDVEQCPPGSIRTPKEILVVCAGGRRWMEASGALGAVWPLPCLEGTEKLVALLRFLSIDWVQTLILKLLPLHPPIHPLQNYRSVSRPDKWLINSVTDMQYCYDR